MIDLPLHPITVHFPIVLGSLLPLVALILWWGIKKDKISAEFWKIVPALALVYALSAVVAVQLGEEDEEKVEKVVSEHLIEEHEEAAEVVPWLGGGLLVISLIGVFRKNSHHARLALVVASALAVAPLGIAGHTGGELVYKYGASFAHLPVQYKDAIKTGVLVRSPDEGPGGEHHEDHDD